MSGKYRVASVAYNDTYKVIGKHPDGRIFAVRHGNTNGLFVVDRDLNLIETLNTTLPNIDVNGLGNGINECVILSTGTMLCWGIYRNNNNITKIYRSDDTSYASFTEVFSLPSDICFIEKSVGVSTKDDTVMCCEYTTVGTDPETGLWLDPQQLNVWRGTNDGRNWEVAFTKNRNPQSEGDTDRIRHFHAVRYDPYEDLFWIASGDWAFECGLWTITPDGTTITKINAEDDTPSNQQWRTTAPMFTKDYVYWGSDASYQSDHKFQRLDRATRLREEIDLLPDDCIRVADKVHLLNGDLLIAQKSYEKAATNTDYTTELYFCDDFQGGDWHSVYSWDVMDVAQVTVFYQITGNKDNRVFISARKIKDENGNNKALTTVILDIQEVNNMGWVKQARETYENILYTPSFKTTNDLEEATKTIIASSEANGTENADYFKALLLPVPSDARLEIMRICARLAVTIDSMTAGHLYCKVYVDAQDADHLLFEKDFTSAAANLDAVDVLDGTKDTIFDMLKDGTAHTFYFFFWVDTGDAVLSLVQLWEAVGTCSTSTLEVMKITHNGMLSIGAYCTKVGTGTITAAVANINKYYEVQAIGSSQRYLIISPGSLHVTAKGTVATDINFVDSIGISLRTLL